MTGAADGKQYGRRHSAWRIDRFDLVFYNSRHKRWQFFAGDPGATDTLLRPAEEGLHRFQIRSLLATFRAAVQKALLELPNHKRRLFEVRSHVRIRDDDDNIDIPLAQFDEWSSYKKIYLDYLINTARYDGVPDLHRRALQKWFEDPTSRVPRAAALTFLSLLPILEDWDSWGCFIRARNGQSLADDAFPPPTARNWSDPFYVVELDFRRDDKSDLDNAKSNSLLGYPVSMEGLCLDLSDGSAVPTKSPKADFFHDRYCKLPVSDSEVVSYRFYAALVDPIMKGLVGEPEERQFVIAYPLAAAGRVHFLQVALTTWGTVHSCVDALWNDWHAVHQVLWRPTFRAFLQEEMYRIIASAFQTEICEHLAEEIRDGKVPGCAEIHRQLHERIYHLFPAQRLVGSGTYTFGEYLFPWPGHELFDPSKRMLVGSKWDLESKLLDGVESPKVPIRPVPIDGAQLYVDAISSDDFAIVLENHRIHQSVQQQAEFLDRLPEGLVKTQRDTERDRLRCVRIVFEHAKKLVANYGPQALDPDPTRRESMRHEKIDFSSLPPEVLAPEGREPFNWRYHPTSFGRYLEGAFKGEDVLSQFDSLRRLSNPSLLMQLSEYFDTGAARIATHSTPSHGPNPFFTGALKDLKTALNDYYSPLCKDVVNAIESNDLSHACTGTMSILQFHGELIELAGKNPNKVVNNADLRSKRSSFQSDSIVVFNQDLGAVIQRGMETRHLQGFRCFGLDPTKVFKPFFRALGAEAKRYLSAGWYRRKLRMDCPIVNPWTPMRTEPPYMRLMEYYLVVGSPTEISIKRLAETGEICKAWGRPQRSIGRFLVCTDSETAVFGDGKFIPDPDLHAGLARDRIISGLPKSEARAYIVINFAAWRWVEDSQCKEDWETDLCIPFNLPALGEGVTA